jgi:hypothetical protein
MEQDANFEYRVSPDEKVTIEVTRHKVNTGIRAALDGNMLTVSQLTNSQQVSFAVTKPKDTAHRLKFWFEFPPKTDDDAYFGISLSGSNSGEFVAGRIMEPGNAEEFNFDTASFIFEVV